MAAKLINRRTRFLLPALVGALGSSLGVIDDAAACGGLFCNAAQPVNQAAERIIFAKNSDGTVSAVIEIMYEGPSEQFAWVLPVPPGMTDVKVASSISLDRIEAQSNPLYRLNVTTDPACFDDVAQDSLGGIPGSVSAPEPAPEDSGVSVVASGAVGPYVYEQIEVDEGLDDEAEVAVNWLQMNGYDVGELGPDRLRPYLQQKMNLLAFKLNKNSNTGSIRPIHLRYESSQPFIPIRPTAVAANPNMGIKVWVLGDSRAIPQNYRHLELNEARIDWFNPGTTYNDVVIAAADEAGGQGFVTEQSAPAGGFGESAYATWEQNQWENLRVGVFQTLQQFFETAVDTFGSYDGFIDVISDPMTTPLRDGATATQFVACVDCYFQQDVAVANEAFPTTPFDPQTDPLLEIDVKKFLDEMDRLVISPLADVRQLFDDNATVTRFYTTMSADEMTEDPAFDFNPELPDVSNVHVATQVFQCDADTEWRVELEQGLIINGNGRTWPVTEESDMPFNLRILQLSTKGDGDVVSNNATTVGSMLIDLGIGSTTDALNTDPPSPPHTDGGVTTEPGGDAGTSSATDDTTDEATDDATDGPPSSEDDVSSDDTSSDDGSLGDAGAEPINPSSRSSSDGGTDVTKADDDGCGCAIPGRERPFNGWLSLPLLGLLLVARRRR